MGDWKNPYRTMDPEFVKKQIEMFYWMISHGYVYQRYMPVYWSPSSKTALAESELEYNVQHKSTSSYVRFPILKNANSNSKISGMSNLYLLIWTTTPWSLVANRAVCYNPESEYCMVKHPNNEDYYIVASETLNQNKELKDIFGKTPDVKDTKLKGIDLSNLTYRNPIWTDKDISMPVLPASYVSVDSGTGLVHTAPAHGPDDYLIGVNNDLDLSCPVDENGRYDNTAPKSLQGLFVLDEGTTEILKILEKGDDLLAKHVYIHSYPYDWRTKKPVLLRASKQWFMDTGTLQPKALEALKNVKIHPVSAVNGFHGILDKRPYWCISRQRVWGVPIPVFYDQKGDPVISKEMVNRYHDLIDQHGPDFWWQMETKEILDGLNVDNSENMTKSNDILDVWFDSGITWHNIIEPNTSNALKQSEVYLEGLDQFSGWFYSSLLTSVAVQNAPPYKKLYVHGFTMDEEGRKMSKSLGNVVSPSQITQGLYLDNPSGKAQESHKAGKGMTKKATSRSSSVYGVDVLR